MAHHSPSSSRDSSSYTAVGATSDDEKAHSSSSPLLPSSASSSSSRRAGSSSPSRRSPRRCVNLSLAALAAVGTVTGLSYAVRHKDGLAALVVDSVAHDARGVPVVDFEAEHVPAEFACNPFKQAGRLLVDLVHPVSDQSTSVSCTPDLGRMLTRLLLCLFAFDRSQGETVWRPYDETCAPSQLMRHLLPRAPRAPTMRAKAKRGTTTHHQMARKVKLAAVMDQTGLVARGHVEDEFDHDNAARSTRASATEGAEFLPWLVNATVLIQGDSIERLHINDFCDFVGGTLTNIDPHHPASPPTYHKPMPTELDADGQETAASLAAKEARRALESSWETEKQASWPYTRPWVCDIPRYGATIVSVFAWGMEDYESLYQAEDFFHGPSTWIDRFRHITLPLLDKLAVHLDRPQIRSPDLIEVGSGFWDLRGMTETDFIEAGFARPYPMDNDLPFGPIGEKRERVWAHHAREMLEEVARAFPGRESGEVRDGPVISWRTMHQPKRNNYTPFTRVFALDQLARKTLHDLRLSSLLTHPNLLKTAKAQLAAAKSKWLATEASSDKPADEAVDYGFDERLRVNEIGRLLTGQDAHFKDFLHPNPVPGSYLWAEIMLYELKRAVAGAGRSAPAHQRG